MNAVLVFFRIPKRRYPPTDNSKTARKIARKRGRKPGMNEVNPKASA